MAPRKSSFFRVSPPLPFPHSPLLAAALLNIKAAMRLTYTTWTATKCVLPSLFPSSTSAPPCLPFPIRPPATALLNIKAAMGLTYTTWVATKPCTLNGATAAAGEWERVTCSADGLAYSINLDSAKLVRKSFPSDISKLTGLGVVWMPWNFLDGSLSDYLKFFSTLTNLNQLAMQYMFFSGSFPSVLTTLPSLTSLSLRFNYLTGSLPSTITKIKSLDINQNYFVGSIPSGTWSYCDATNNCLTGAGNCQNYYQRSSCAICGSTAGTGTLCAAGQSCMPSADAKIAAGQNNYGGEVALSCVYTPITMNPADGQCRLPAYSFVRNRAHSLSALHCPLRTHHFPVCLTTFWFTPPCHPPAAAAMLNVKASLGVTYTTWAATTPCRFDQSTVALANEWTGVRCTDTGKVSDIVVNYANLKGSLPSDISTLTSLTRIGAPGNYLIGTVPPLGPLLLRIDVNYNFITDLPTAAYTWCGGNLNCLVTPSKCTTSGTVQRAAADCAFCGTPNGAGPFCWGAGGVCTPDATAPVAAGTANPNSQPALPRTCVGGPVAALKDSTAMLALKASLGVTLTTWAATVPCKVAGQTTTVTVWSGVLCDSTGRVVSMRCLPYLHTIFICSPALARILLRSVLPPTVVHLRAVDNSKLKGSLASDISTLTALTYLNLQGNLLSYRIDSFTTNLRALPVLADIGAVYNYFIGTVPALASGLLSLDVRGNFLTDVPTASYSWCGGAGNCLLTPSKCTSGGSAQRPAADCAFCGTTNAVGPFCVAAGGVCTVDSGSAVNTGTVNSPTQPVLPVTCVGGTLYMNAGDGGPTAVLGGSTSLLHCPPLALPHSPPPPVAALLNIKSAMWAYQRHWRQGKAHSLSYLPPVPVPHSPLSAAALLNIKSAMGLTYTSWAATNPCTLDGATAKAGEWERVACTPFGRAYVMWMPWNFLDGSLSDYLKFFSTLTNLNQLPLHVVPCMSSPACRPLHVVPCMSSPACRPLHVVPCMSSPACRPLHVVPCMSSPACRPLHVVPCMSSPACRPLHVVPCMSSPACRPLHVVPCMSSPACLPCMSSPACRPLHVVPCMSSPACLPCMSSPACRPLHVVPCMSSPACSPLHVVPCMSSPACSPLHVSPACLPMHVVSCMSAPWMSAMQYMFFSGSFPSVLTTLPSLTSLSVRFNYLTGSLPSTITKIKSLDLYQNYFVGSIPSGTWSYCNAANNCLASVGNCQSAFQRSSCAICGSTDGTGTLCTAGQACVPGADAKIAAGQNNYGGEVALSCVYQPITMNSADGQCHLPSFSFPIARA
ncbi:unnamed protein product [Closterium sp. Naga37s-1]|nr:unnamed protein product [Closterium sp. Naga37s-1]